MAVRVGQTRNAAPRLLKTVGGRPYATKEDHEVVQQEQAEPAEGLSLAEQEEMGFLNDDHVNTHPVSSSDEAWRKPMPKSKTNDRDALKKPPGSARKRKAELLPPGPEPEPEPEPEPGLRKPTRTKTRTAAPRVPKRGQYEQSRAAKEGLDGEKENTVGKQTPPTSSQDVWGFGMSSQTSQKGPKVTFGGSKNKNIHTAPPSAKKARGKPVTFGSKSNQKAGHSWNPQPEDDDSDNVSMLSEPMNDKQLEEWKAFADMPEPEPEDPELRKVPPKKKKPAPTNGDAPESAGMDDTELDNILKPTLREQLGLTDAPDSSLLPSSAPQEDMDKIDSYVRKLPAEAEEGTVCPICNEPVDQDYYWDFWKGRKKTVKNQAAFCHTHRRATAQKEYLAEGFPAVDGVPTINWPALPDRIKRHRMDLHQILIGKKDSTYRTRYEPLALTGKAAAVPSKRHDLSPSLQSKLSSYALDSHFVYPGYYGPRGRRLITESVMALLHTEIKRCTDAVVQTSGPATFVQAVLVPEVAVRLIMEDLRTDWEGAEEVRERTWEMGVLLNEEIEDNVEVGEEEGEGENEYHH